MSVKSPPSDLPIHAFPSAEALKEFLDREHTIIPGFYLKFAKKSSGIPSVSGSEAVETALCYGWIDGRANGLDDQWWLVRYTPRRAKSIWSKKNVATIARLAEEGRIRPAGIAAVEAAKADGRWDRAYAGPATIEVPVDLATALAGELAAKRFFEGMNKTNRYSVLWRVETASPKARAGRIEAMLKMLVEGKSPRAMEKPKRKAIYKGSKITETQSTQDLTRKQNETARPRRNDAMKQSRRAGLRQRNQTQEQG
ncbi:uncharacterized protein KY384_007560 [Bacidia gigantensis]|uniref:uncharacterized protein n=1 Tax=Bacidia gigantensis TaxID=2732470 RepID=UPI001D040E7C|nr:uncharacterized protein KY384_007560 [Bacidia gigantensis]KAG8527408.1 hypothetical protein KY384_007560 [Bacidia gigantensis]